MINLFDINFFFFFFSFLSILSSFFLIISKNPLHSIIFLILVFFNIIFLLLLHEIEFISMIYLIVYVGAIAVLFLFIIYMLNIRAIELNEFNWQYLIGILFSFIFFLIFFFLFIFNKKLFLFINFNHSLNIEQKNFFDLFYDSNNIKFLSILLYEDNFFSILIISLILLIAMVGSIVLTSKKTFFLNEQIIFQQNRRFIKTQND